jgi:hypothetical protein
LPRRAAPKELTAIEDSEEKTEYRLNESGLIRYFYFSIFRPLNAPKYLIAEVGPAKINLSV